MEIPKISLAEILSGLSETGGTTLADIANGGALRQQFGLSGVLSKSSPQGILSNPHPQWLTDEMKFQAWIRSLPWFQEFKQNYGEEPNLSPSANYDYRAAHRAGISPVRDPHDNNRYHWPSSAPGGQMLKSAGHPTAWKEHFMRETGKNPDALGLQDPAQANAWKSRFGK